MTTRANLFHRPGFVFVRVLSLALLAMPLSAIGQEASKETPDSGGSIAIKLGGEHFTTLELKKYRRPVLYPIYGPGEVPMTRDFPMKKGTAGEATDHPHHKSIWCAHGLINEVSFWHEEGQIQYDESKPLTLEVSDDKKITVRFHANYLDKDGKLICSDSNEIAFHEMEDGSRAIDWDLTIHASEGELLFGDTKEGMMAIRTHPSLRIDKGATAINSEGVGGKELWGKKAKWLDYHGTVAGKHVGVAIFDHPNNLRHPTTWHARAYGLVAANPFGLHHFEGKPKGVGDHKLAKGESIRWRYRFVFHEGDEKSANIEKLYSQFAK